VLQSAYTESKAGRDWRQSRILRGFKPQPNRIKLIVVARDDAILDFINKSEE
jgi:hypothetical protein